MNYETKVDLAGGKRAPVDDFDPALDDAASIQRRRRRRVILFAVIAAVLAIGIFWLLHGEEEAAFAPREGTAPAVTVAIPGRGTVEGVINATGTLAARREMPVGIVGEGGRVVSVPVEPGDWVRAGQVLASIDRSVQNQQLGSLAAQIDVARADAELAQANLARALQLVERGFISKADVDRLTATRDAARARVEVARAQYRELQARNARLNIVAPAAGLVLERNVEPGQVVGGGSGVLFSIARGGEMELLAQLGESDLAAVSTGVRAIVSPVGTEKSFAGQVWQVSPVIEEENRQGIARIALAYAPELRPGGFATVRINSGAVVAPMLPESAILSDERGSYVYVIDKENRARRTPVELGLITSDGIVIRSGLSGSERVVMRAGGFLTEEEEVRPIMAAD